LEKPLSVSHIGVGGRVILVGGPGQIVNSPDENDRRNGMVSLPFCLNNSSTLDCSTLKASIVWALAGMFG
jgi:hypothetical protein